MEEADREILTGSGPRSNYATRDNLSKRQSIFAYLDPALSSGGIPIDRLDLTGDERVIDVGCGNGLWLDHVRQRAGWVVGVDLSAGMLAAAREEVGDDVAVIQAEAQRLPLASGSAEGILAMHVLYHVADIPAALAEFARVLKPGGWMLATTNSGTPNRAAELYQASVEAVLGAGTRPILPSLPFDSENGGAVLATGFPVVEATEHVAGFSVTDAHALVAPLKSVRDVVEATLARPLDWDAIDVEVVRTAEVEIAATGAFRYQQRVTSFLCRAAG